ncbi:MAG: hypothetical protein OJF58_004133 [Enhydrobacter sp.]|jgi:hypothetical protein|nr:MAG: hypothetical protein OJF58_004133 [Enhydrobacter sp.]
MNIPRSAGIISLATTAILPPESIVRCKKATPWFLPWEWLSM